MTPEERDQLAEEISAAFAKRYFANLSVDTTAADWQRIAGELGAVTGRIVAAARWEGPINGDLLMHMRHGEQVGITSMQTVFRGMTAPGVAIAEIYANQSTPRNDES
ncbi:hypothetical protein [Pseudomonas oryzihabitans]|uniref:hypothetical protein n=1 Tax=Pseudomonas oryzihabitans TaxID=47885 RepID=UPI0028942228|nr:hypothetical protein [Pseudomonas oryzihabitans]MDT3720353.1 hypothetical protein [Pseudomonas oryzihabitans]